MRAWAPLSAVMLASCDIATPERPTAVAVIEQASGIALGNSFDSVLAAARSYVFNPVAMHECRAAMAARGCFLSPADNLDTFVSIADVPLGLSARLNRQGNVIGYSLSFERREFDDPAQQMTEDECRDVAQRLMMWMRQNVGSPSPPRTMEAGFHTVRIEGSDETYQEYRPEHGGFSVYERWPGPERSVVSLRANFILLDGNSSCHIGISTDDLREQLPPARASGASEPRPRPASHEETIPDPEEDAYGDTLGEGDWGAPPMEDEGRFTPEPAPAPAQMTPQAPATASPAAAASDGKNNPAAERSSPPAAPNSPAAADK